MTDRPILMSAPMVRALLKGRKTQTRRLTWRRCERDCMDRWYPKPLDPWGPTHCHKTIWQLVKPGDRLWVRETHKQHPTTFLGLPSTPEVMYEDDEDYDICDGMGWRIVPSIHMPRWASRLTLLVTATKTERVQEISTPDCWAEGFLSEVKRGPVERDTPLTAIERFGNLWRTLHTKPGTRWEDNPEVAAITFDMKRGNVDD